MLISDCWIAETELAQTTLEISSISNQQSAISNQQSAISNQQFFYGRSGTAAPDF
jgi:hypothetical protein